MDPLPHIALALLLTGVVAASLMWLLRGAGIAGGRPAAAIVGGVLAGTLLGPAVLGQVAPGVHMRLFRGGEAERAALNQTLARHRADQAAAMATGGSPAMVADMFARHSLERAPLAAALQQSTAARRSAIAGGATLMVAAAILLLAWWGRPLSVPRWSVAMGAVAVALECAFIGAVASLLLGARLELALAAGAAGAGGSALAGVPMRWVPRAGRGELARGTGAVMFILAMAAVVALSDGAGRVWAAALLAAPMLGWSLRLLVGAGSGGRERTGLAAPMRDVFLWIVLPMAAATAAQQVEWDRVGDLARAQVAVAVMVLLSGNAAFVGLLIAGWVIPWPDGQRPATSESLLKWQAAGFGVTQVCVILVIVAAGIADPTTPIGSGVIAGLLLSAAIGEMTLGWLREALAKSEERPG